MGPEARAYEHAPEALLISTAVSWGCPTFWLSRNGNPLETGAGAVSQDEEAPGAQLGEAMMGWKNKSLYSRNKITYMGPYRTICTRP